MLQLPTQTVSRAFAKPDPILDMIRQHVAQRKAAWGLYDDLEVAENKAAKVHGRRPISLVAWRNYSHISGSELEDRREEFLAQDGADPKLVEREYRDAKAREAAIDRAALDWDKKTGLAKLRREQQRAQSAEVKYSTKLAKTRPTTAAGVAALLQHVMDDELCDEVKWHVLAIKTAIATLNQMDRGGSR